MRRVYDFSYPERTGTQTVAEQVEAVREQLAMGIERPSYWLTSALHNLHYLAGHDSANYEAIERWARLAADLAAMLQKKC